MLFKLRMISLNEFIENNQMQLFVNVLTFFA